MKKAPEIGASSKREVGDTGLWNISKQAVFFLTADFITELPHRLVL